MKRLVLSVADGSGDRLVALLNEPVDRATGGSAPLVLLIHGLTGCAESSYIRASARQFLTLGYRVLRLNLRGAGASRPTCRFQYHAGRSADLRAALAALDPALTTVGVLLVGFSLGGAMLLKYLAEAGSDGGVRAAAAVSAPLDLLAATRRILEPRNAAYHLYLLSRMKEESTMASAELTPAERRTVAAARTLFQFDDRFTAPRNGFAGALDYYRRSSPCGFLADIAVPTLVIHAKDDPWIPVNSYCSFDWSANSRLTLLLAESGGHLGFHGRGHAVPWHDRCIARYFRELTG